MSRVFGFVMLLIVVAAGMGFYARQARTVSAGGNPSANVDIVGVKHDLMSIAQAERTHNALHGGYASLDDLRAAAELSMSTNNRGFYNYTAETTDSGFRVVATYAGPDNPLAPRSLSIDQTMSIMQE